MYDNLNYATSSLTHNKNIILLLDLNIPFKDNQILDTYRLDQALISINNFKNAKNILILSHLGRPCENEIQNFMMTKKTNFSLKIVYEYFKEKIPIKFIDELKLVPDAINYKIENTDNNDKNMENNIFLLENTRLFKSICLGSFLIEYFDFTIFDAFSAAHRKILPNLNLKKIYPGILVFQELEKIKKYNFDLIIIGGSKIEDKASLIRKFLGKKKIFFGSKYGFEMLKNTDEFCEKIKSIDSEFEEDEFRSHLESYLNDNKRDSLYNDYELSRFVEKTIFFIPIDFLTENNEIINYQQIFDYDSVIDIGPKSLRMLKEAISQSEEIFWNGPLGIFEDPKCTSTKELIEMLNSKKCLVGGGETNMAVKKYGGNLEMSTGGGALLNLLANVDMPGLDACERITE